MDNPEITSFKILTVLSEKWSTLENIIEEMGLLDSLDIKYLNLKLKELNQKKKVIYKFDNNDFYWKTNRPEYITNINLADIDFYSDILDIDPFDAEIWRYLGDIYSKLNEFELSIECYKNVIRLVDIDIELELYTKTLSVLGLIYYELEDYDKSLKTFKALLELRQELELETTFMTYVLIAYIYADDHEYKQALDYAEKAKKIHPENKLLEEIYNFALAGLQEFQDNNLSVFSIPDQEKDELEMTLLASIQKEIKVLRKETKRSSEIRNIILTKSYINSIIRPYFDKLNNKNVKKLQSMIERHREGWPDEMWKLFVEEYNRTLERYKELQPSKWKKWGKALVNLITPIIVK